MDILHIKTGKEWAELKPVWTKNEEQLADAETMSDSEFRARFKERCHHTMEIQIYDAIESGKPLRADQTETAEMYFRVWEKRGLSHELPEYMFASELLAMARKLQNGEMPDLGKWEPHWFTEEDRVIFDRAIYERRSVRHWDWERDVPQEVIDKVLDAGLWAAHACNLQSIRYLVVHEQKAPGLFRGGDIPPGPVHIVVCQDSRTYRGNMHMPDYNAVLDAGAAGQNILLAAHAQGLGACWITFTSSEMKQRLVDRYDLPDYIDIVFYIDLGWPVQTPCPPARIGTEEAVLVRE